MPGPGIWCQKNEELLFFSSPDSRPALHLTSMCLMLLAACLYYTKILYCWPWLVSWLCLVPAVLVILLFVGYQLWPYFGPCSCLLAWYSATQLLLTLAHLDYGLAYRTCDFLCTSACVPEFCTCSNLSICSIPAVSRCSFNYSLCPATPCHQQEV